MEIIKQVILTDTFICCVNEGGGQHKGPSLSLLKISQGAQQSALMNTRSHLILMRQVKTLFYR